MLVNSETAVHRSEATKNERAEKLASRAGLTVNPGVTQQMRQYARGAKLTLGCGP
jgi:hypothetical protein